jgi:hypothetical protein
MQKMRSIVEFGCGKHPFGLLSKAQKAQKEGKLRSFIGVDIAKAQVAETARFLGLKKVPENTLFIESDAVEQIKKFLPKSKDLIVASNLFTRSYHDYFVMMGYTGALERKMGEFLLEAKRVLVSNGRVVLVQSKIDASALKNIAKENGFSAHLIELTDAQAQKSLAQYTRRVSTPEKRLLQRNRVFGENSKIQPSDLQPIMVILRKIN